MKEYIRRYFMLRRHNMKVAIKKAKMSKMCYAFLAPYAIIFALFYILPVITSIFYSFTYYNILESPKFVGLQNYINLILQDDVFLIGVKNTFVPGAPDPARCFRSADPMIEELNITVPVALHLDHGTYEGCYKCIEAGFSSIMFDGSHYPIEENVAKTKELVAVCKEHGMSLEAEVGSIGGEEDGVVGMGECADPNECKMIADLGVDMLAAGIGNIHGVYPANWQGLSFETLAAVQELTGTMPLVLHGGTGIPDDMINKAIDLGVSKINVNTECQLAFAAATRKYIEEGKDQQGKGFDPRKLLAPGAEAIKATVREKIELFGSANKA